MLHMANQELGDFIRSERERRNISMRRLADMAGVSFSLIGKIERGEVKLPSQAVLESVGRSLNVPYETLDRIARGLPVGEPSSGLDSETARVLELFNNLSPEQRRDAIDYLEYKMNRKR